MRHRGWFRLVIRAFGALLIAESAYAFTVAISDALRSGLFGELWNVLSPYGSHTLAQWSTLTLLQQLSAFAPPLVQIAIGAYLFRGGRWIVNRCLPPSAKYCIACGCPFPSPVTPRCPDCGALAESSSSPTLPIGAAS